MVYFLGEMVIRAQVLISKARHIQLIATPTREQAYDLLNE